MAENNNYSFSHNVYYINSTVIIFCKFSSLDNTIEPGLYEKTSNTFIAEPTTSFPFLLNCFVLWQICFHVCLKLSSFIWKSRLRPLSHSFFFPFKSDLFLRFSGNNQDSRVMRAIPADCKKSRDLRTRTDTPDAQQTFSHHRPFSAETLI